MRLSSAGWFLAALEKAFDAKKLTFYGSLAPLRDGRAFRRYGQAYRQQRGDCLSTAQRRVMTAIERCRTAALGGHVEQCDTCGYQRISDNSCRDRHCPKCQSLARAQWLDDRRSELLAVPYFHVVFTMLQQIAAIAFHNKAPVYDILFLTPPKPC